MLIRLGCCTQQQVNPKIIFEQRRYLSPRFHIVALPTKTPFNSFSYLFSDAPNLSVRAHEIKCILIRVFTSSLTGKAWLNFSGNFFIQRLSRQTHPVTKKPELPHAQLTWKFTCIGFVTVIKALLGMLARLPWGRRGMLGSTDGKHVSLC